MKIGDGPVDYKKHMGTFRGDPHLRPDDPRRHGAGP
jgi:hypothetical protein